MNKRVMAGIAGLLLSGIVIAVIRHESGPTYKGRSLLYWVRNIQSDRIEENEGLSALGTSAIPAITKLLHTKASAYGKWLSMLRPHLPVFVERLVPKGMTPLEANGIRFDAACA